MKLKVPRIVRVTLGLVAAAGVVTVAKGGLNHSGADCAPIAPRPNSAAATVGFQHCNQSLEEIGVAYDTHYPKQGNRGLYKSCASDTKKPTLNFQTPYCFPRITAARSVFAAAPPAEIGSKSNPPIFVQRVKSVDWVFVPATGSLIASPTAKRERAAGQLTVLRSVGAKWVRQPGGLDEARDGIAADQLVTLVTTFDDFLVRAGS
ncbi:MAG TPA: hypothetical protein VMT30_07095 [Candidatus Saccharimonadia bacterium]|nr:hypothetical protein [Candidatus Saccharimonadia bacterium]